MLVHYILKTSDSLQWCIATEFIHNFYVFHLITCQTYHDFFRFAKQCTGKCRSRNHEVVFFCISCCLFYSRDFLTIFLFNNQLFIQRTIYPNLFCHKTLHVSGRVRMELRSILTLLGSGHHNLHETYHLPSVQ